jgi:RNA polymerase sigma-70 factor (sigma-E family)
MDDLELPLRVHQARLVKQMEPLVLQGSEGGIRDAPGDTVAIDDAEFRDFFASQYDRLCWLGLLLTGSRAEAEDLAQEALVRTWWRWQLVRRPDDPERYVRKVLVNRQRSLLRRALRETRALAWSRPQEQIPPTGDERDMVLWQAVQALPARQRAVLMLRYQEDLTEHDVARLLGLPLGTVKSRTHRALARLRRQLGSPTLDATSTIRKDPR